LNGTVTFSPRPPSATKRAHRRRSRQAAEDATVFHVLPGLRANAAWISGDLLWAIGLPMTA
jgi:hypothetical protein